MPRQKDRGLRRGQGYTERRVAKDGTVFYVARWREGVAYRSKVFRDPDPATALEAAEQFIRDRDRALRIGRHIPPAEMTVMDLVNQYLARGQSRWAPNTYGNYCLLARLHIEPDLGNLRLSNLDTSRVQHWIDQRVKAGYTPETVRALSAVLISALNEAVALKLILENPAKGVKRPRLETPAHVTWSATEVRQVLATLADQPMWDALYRTALLTGMRPGELMALRWSDLDLDAGEITIHRTMTRDHRRRMVVGTTTKTQRSRRVAIPPSLVTILRRWKVKQTEQRLRSRSWHDTGAVFTGRTGRHLAQSTWSQWHAALCERMQASMPEGETFPRPTLHELRHTAATLMLENNVHVKVVSDMLGHRKIETTLNTYQHVSADLQRSASEGLDRLLNTTTLPPERAENG